MANIITISNLFMFISIKNTWGWEYVILLLFTCTKLFFFASPPNIFCQTCICNATSRNPMHTIGLPGHRLPLSLQHDKYLTSWWYKHHLEYFIR